VLEGCDNSGTAQYSAGGGKNTVQVDVVYIGWCVAGVLRHQRPGVCVCVCGVVVLEACYTLGTAHCGVSGVVGADLCVAGKLCLV
jgi:hypothetical protein